MESVCPLLVCTPSFFIPGDLSADGPFTEQMLAGSLLGAMHTRTAQAPAHTGPRPAGRAHQGPRAGVMGTGNQREGASWRRTGYEEASRLSDRGQGLCGDWGCSEGSGGKCRQPLGSEELRQEEGTGTGNPAPQPGLGTTPCGDPGRGGRAARRHACPLVRVCSQGLTRLPLPRPLATGGETKQALGPGTAAPKPMTQ